MLLPLRLAALTAATSLLLAGCGTDGLDGSEPAATPEAPFSQAPADQGHADHHGGEGAADGGTEGGHDHSSHPHVSLPVGDGTRASEVGYALEDLRLPRRAGEPGTLSFAVTFRDVPQVRFLEEQTERMHVYVVREDLEVFRHVHPELAEDGTWSTRLTLPTPGTYRVVTEFIAQGAGGNGDHLILGDAGRVAGEEPAQAGSQTADLGLDTEIVGKVPAAGREGQLGIALTRDGDGRGPVTLGSYLGTSAHLTGFHRETGATVHMHPLGDPVARDGGGQGLVFHAALPDPGDYRLFLQVRVDELVHTLPLEITAR